MPGATGLLPVDTAPPSSIGGIANPSAPGNLVEAPSAANAPPPISPGGLDPTSILNQGITSSNQAIIAQSNTQTLTTQTIFPADGYIAPPTQLKVSTFLADFYRNGNQAGAGGNVSPRTLDDFNSGVDDIAQIYVYYYDPKAKMDKPLVPPFSKFILEGVNEQHAERSQIVETFGDFYVFLFGERPPMYNFTGTLINSKNANWVSDFKYYYDAYLRGTKCVENSARLVITYGGRQIEGFMLSMQTATDATVEKGVKLSFPVVVTKKSFIQFSDDFGFVVSGGITFQNASLTAQLNTIAGKTGAGSSNPTQSAATQAVTGALQNGGLLAGIPLGVLG